VPPSSPAHVLRDATMYCGKDSATCEFFFLERNGLAAEVDFK
jgi:hypothetical protein